MPEKIKVPVKDSNLNEGYVKHHENYDQNRGNPNKEWGPISGDDDDDDN